MLRSQVISIVDLNMLKLRGERNSAALYGRKTAVCITLKSLENSILMSRPVTLRGTRRPYETSDVVFENSRDTSKDAAGLASPLTDF